LYAFLSKIQFASLNALFTVRLSTRQTYKLRIWSSFLSSFVIYNPIKPALFMLFFKQM
jgi:hypothetical protein